MTTGKRVRHFQAARRRRGRKSKTETQKQPGKRAPIVATVSVESAARMLSVSRRTVQYMLEDGRLRGSRTTPRGWWRVRKASLGKLIAKLEAARASKAALLSRKKHRDPAAQQTPAGPVPDGTTSASGRMAVRPDRESSGTGPAPDSRSSASSADSGQVTAKSSEPAP